jgi:hypothetical protein
MKAKILTTVFLLAAGFIFGVVLQYSKQRQLERDLSSAQQQLATYRASSQLWQLRDSAAMLGLAVARSNYGTASQYSTRFFDQARDVSAQNLGLAINSSLQEILNSRDKITAGIAKQDPAVLSDIQAIVSKVHEGSE